MCDRSQFHGQRRFRISCVALGLLLVLALTAIPAHSQATQGSVVGIACPTAQTGTLVSRVAGGLDLQDQI